MDIDEALAHLGKYGKWQMRTYILFCIGYSMPMAFGLAFIFIGRYTI